MLKYSGTEKTNDFLYVPNGKLGIFSGIPKFRHITEVCRLVQTLGHFLRSSLIWVCTVGPKIPNTKDYCFAGWFHEGIFLHFCASMISGLVTTAASMPVDIAKTRSVTHMYMADPL